MLSLVADLDDRTAHRPPDRLRHVPFHPGFDTRSIEAAYALVTDVPAMCYWTRYVPLNLMNSSSAAERSFYRSPPYFADAAL